MRIFKSLFILAWIFLLNLPAGSPPAYSQSPAAESGKKKPIEINSDKLRSENEGKKIIFSGNVVSTWGDLEIKSNILEIYANPKKGKSKRRTGSEPQEQDIDEIIAKGNVRIKKGDRRAKGDFAHYFNKEQKIFITGEPHATAWEGNNIIHGGKMTFYLERDLFEVNERVHLVLFPKNPPPEHKK